MISKVLQPKISFIEKISDAARVQTPVLKHRAVVPGLSAMVLNGLIPVLYFPAPVRRGPAPVLRNLSPLFRGLATVRSDRKPEFPFKMNNSHSLTN